MCFFLLLRYDCLSCFYLEFCLFKVICINYISFVSLEAAYIN